jgi:hypothetical protein
MSASASLRRTGGALLLAALCCAPAAGFELITADELRQARKTPEATSDAGSAAVAIAGAPVISVVRPNLQRPLRSPADIDISFTPQGEAQIVPESLKVRYAFFDLTSRLRKYARISARGLELRGAELPTGDFTLRIEISDSLKRTGRLDLSVTVE